MVKTDSFLAFRLIETVHNDCQESAAEALGWRCTSCKLHVCMMAALSLLPQFGALLKHILKN